MSRLSFLEIVKDNKRMLLLSISLYIFNKNVILLYNLLLNIYKEIWKVLTNFLKIFNKGFGFGIMNILNNFYALKDANAPMSGPETWNKRGDTLTVQAEGTFTGELLVLGCSDLESEEYHVLSGFDSSFNIVDKMVAAGIYTFPIEGMGKYRVKLNAISGGKVSAFCRVTTGG